MLLFLKQGQDRDALCGRSGEKGVCPTADDGKIGWDMAVLWPLSTYLSHAVTQLWLLKYFHVLTDRWTCRLLHNRKVCVVISEGRCALLLNFVAITFSILACSLIGLSFCSAWAFMECHMSSIFTLTSLSSGWSSRYDNTIQNSPVIFLAIFHCCQIMLVIHGYVHCQVTLGYY